MTTSIARFDGLAMAEYAHNATDKNVIKKPSEDGFFVHPISKHSDLLMNVYAKH